MYIKHKLHVIQQEWQKYKLLEWWQVSLTGLKWRCGRIRGWKCTPNSCIKGLGSWRAGLGSNIWESPVSWYDNSWNPRSEWDNPQTTENFQERTSKGWARCGERKLMTDENQALQRIGRHTKSTWRDFCGWNGHQGQPPEVQKGG